ncbi:MAG: hypothetical protein HY720_09505 [Planctomycetes bacterium]|nr:hypothetical protein [Planctomycetota bacterium]
MTAIERLYVDFNAREGENSELLEINAYWLGQRNPGLLARLLEGMRVTLFDDEMEVESTLISLDARRGVWRAAPNWDTLRYL